MVGARTAIRPCAVAVFLLVPTRAIAVKQSAMMGDDLAKLRERVRGRIRRGASARHSLAWWWMSENWRRINGHFGKDEPDWSALSVELTALGVKASPADVRRTWVLVRDQWPAEQERQGKAQAERRHVQAWKVEGKLPRNPGDQAKRRARIERDREQRQERAERRARLAAALPALRPGEIAPCVMAFREPPPPPEPPSPEVQAAFQAAVEQFRSAAAPGLVQRQAPEAQEGAGAFSQPEVARGLLARTWNALRGLGGNGKEHTKE
jgi:hypothetical protein